jgi:hypothetical protein
MPIIELDKGLSIVQPTEGDIARTGSRRIVKLIPIPGGAAPAIWTGPVKTDDIGGEKVVARVCIVLVSKNPPETSRITVPSDLYDKLPDVPVEW